MSNLETRTRDKAWRLAEARLGWAAIVGYGYEAGSWIKLAVTTDVEAYAKVGRSHHPQDYRERFVLWVDLGKDCAEMVLEMALGMASQSQQRLNGSCVALPVAAAQALVEEAAVELRCRLYSPAERDIAVEHEIRQGWR